MTVVTMDDFAPLLERPDVTQKKAFGRPSLFVNGNMFLTLLQDGVTYKLKEADFTGTPAEGKTRHLGGARIAPKKNWTVVPFEVDADCLDFAGKALAVAAKLPPK